MQAKASEYLHVKEAAALIGQHEVTVRRHIASGGLAGDADAGRAGRAGRRAAPVPTPVRAQCKLTPGFLDLRRIPAPAVFPFSPMPVPIDAELRRWDTRGTQGLRLRRESSPGCHSRARRSPTPLRRALLIRWTGRSLGCVKAIAGAW